MKSPSSVSDSILIIEGENDNDMQVEVTSEDSSSSILFEQMDASSTCSTSSLLPSSTSSSTSASSSSSTSISDLNMNKEPQERKPEAFSIVYESYKSSDENSGLETSRENLYAKKYRKRSASASSTLSKPPNSSVLRTATNRPNYTGLSNGSEKVHTCILCSKSFKKRNNLVAHTVRIHSSSGSSPSVGPGFCQICSKSFKNLKGLKRHQLAIHSDESQCGPAAQSSNLLTDQDQDQIIKVKPFNCPNCDIIFRRKSQLDGHIKIHKNTKKKSIRMLKVS